MPGFDGAGPDGQGPMTGRGMGRCNRSSGCRRGRGTGRGAFCRFTDNNGMSQQDRLEVLKADKKRLEAEIEMLEGEQKR